MEKSDVHLSRRERQIMDAVYRLGEATAGEIRENMPDPPSYSAVRALLKILEKKGHLKHKKDRHKYVFLATRSRRTASQSALDRVLRTFFDGSVEKAVAALLDASETEISAAELDRLSRLIDEAKKGGR